MARDILFNALSTQTGTSSVVGFGTKPLNLQTGFITSPDWDDSGTTFFIILECADSGTFTGTWQEISRVTNANPNTFYKGDAYERTLIAPFVRARFVSPPSNGGTFTYILYSD